MKEKRLKFSKARNALIGLNMSYKKTINHIKANLQLRIAFKAKIKKLQELHRAIIYIYELDLRRISQGLRDSK